MLVGCALACATTSPWAQGIIVAEHDRALSKSPAPSPASPGIMTLCRLNGPC